MKHIKQVYLICLLCNFYFISSQVNLNSNLTACYNLNGNASDPISALNGTLYSASLTADRFGNPGSALALSGSTSSMIRLPASSLIKPSPAISISGWYKVNSFVNNSLIIFTKNVFSSHTAAYALQIQNYGGGYKFAAWRQDGTTSDYVEGTTVISQNTWYHVVFIINGSYMSIYVNGQLENTVPITITNFNYDINKGVILGGTNESASNIAFNGCIDNLRFYSRILKSTEVSALYNQDPTCIPVPVASFSLSSSICAGKSVIATDLSSGSATSWTWQTPGAKPSMSSVPNPTLSYDNPGTYSISLTASNGGGMGTTSVQTITVLPSPTVSAASTRTLYGRCETCTVYAQGATSYSWSTGHTASVVVIYPPLTETIFSVTGFGSNGCVNTGTLLIRVSTCGGIEDLTDEAIVVYPNPTTDYLNISSKGYDAGKALLLNYTGQILEKVNLNAGDGVLDLTRFSEGVYFIILTDGTKTKRATILKE